MYNKFRDLGLDSRSCLKGGAYICYCAYVLHISRYSGFLWVVPTNKGIFLRSLKQNLASALRIPKENGGNHAFLIDNKAKHPLYFTAF